jgi:hypothetical protein
MFQVRVLILILLLCGITWGQKSILSEPYLLKPPSLINVLANPERYDGKRISISGFLHYQFEDSALYFSKSDADYLITENAIWIRYGEKPIIDAIECKGKSKASTSNLDYLDGHYVSLEGTFNMNERGHMGAFSGTLENVVRVSEQRRWFDGKKKIANFKDGRITPTKCEE